MVSFRVQALWFLQLSPCFGTRCSWQRREIQPHTILDFLKSRATPSTYIHGSKSPAKLDCATQTTCIINRNAGMHCILTNRTRRQPPLPAEAQTQHCRHRTTPKTFKTNARNKPTPLCRPVRELISHAACCTENKLQQAILSYVGPKAPRAFGTNGQSLLSGSSNYYAEAHLHLQKHLGSRRPARVKIV